VFLTEVAVAEATITNDALRSVFAILEAATRLTAWHFVGMEKEA
jgi:hypothetical protein